MIKNFFKPFSISDSKARNTLSICLLLCLTWAFCRGFYMPSTWSLNYWLISFFDGFGRRALLGSLLYPFGALRHHYHFVAAFQIAASVTLLAVALRRLSIWSRKNAATSIYIYIFLCGFFLSKYGAFLFGTTGYVDYPHYLLILLALLTPNDKLRILLATSTIWVHEAAALTCLPLYFAVEVLYYRRYKAAFATLAASMISFILIFTFLKTPSPDVIENYRSGFLAHLNYTPRSDYLEQVFAADNMKFYFRAATHYKYKMLDYAVFCLLLACMLVWLLCRSRALPWSGCALAWLCIISPLSLGFFAYDINRWIFLTLIHIGVMFAIFQEHMNSRERIGFIAASFAVFFSSYVPMFHERHYREIHELLPFIKNLGKILASTPYR